MGTKVKCFNCGEILESRFTHDFQSCDCDNNTFVDGGNKYARIGGKYLEKIGRWDKKRKEFIALVGDVEYKESLVNKIKNYFRNIFKK